MIEGYINIDSEIRLYYNKNNEDVSQKTIIFLHDSLGCVTLWRDFPKILSNALSCNYLLYDRQGYGKSSPFTIAKRSHNYLELEATVLHDIIVKENLNDVILFGHSDGGSIALLAAAKYPERIKGVITEGAHVFVENITLDGIRDAVTAYHTTNLKNRLSKYHYDNTEKVFSMWADTWLREGFEDWNIESFLSKITCPSLIIQGENDEFGTEKQVDAIVSQTTAKSTKCMIPREGHTPHKTASKEMITACLNFVKEI